MGKREEYLVTLNLKHPSIMHYEHTYSVLKCAIELYNHSCKQGIMHYKHVNDVLLMFIMCYNAL